jgi:epsilon-lactone hydrolase
MISPQAQQLWDAFRQAPKEIGLALEARREAGEQAEGPTSEPARIQVEPEPAVDGLWVTPSSGGDRATILYFFGGGYVLGSPASRRKTAGHLANAADARVLLANYRLAPESKFPRALVNVVDAMSSCSRATSRPTTSSSRAIPPAAGSRSRCSSR